MCVGNGRGRGAGWLAQRSMLILYLYIYIEIVVDCVGPNLRQGSGSCPDRIDYLKKKFIYLFIYFVVLDCLDVFIGGGRVFGWFLFFFFDLAQGF